MKIEQMKKPGIDAQLSSQLKQCQENFLPSSMTQPRPNPVMLLHIHKEGSDKLNLMTVAKEDTLANLTT